MEDAGMAPPPPAAPEPAPAPPPRRAPLLGVNPYAQLAPDPAALRTNREEEGAARPAHGAGRYRLSS